MPIEKPDIQKIGALVEQLDHDDFKIRDRASKELGKIGAAAEDALVRASKSNSAEVRNRARLLLAEIKDGQSSDPSIRRELRAVVVLGRIANPRAVEYLEELAKSDEASLRRGQARSTLERLK
jgi:HEAT repeat protein